MSANQRPLLLLQPSVNTTTVTTTTTTTTTYAPITLPPLPPPSSPKDPKNYPLLHASLPQSLRKFPLVFPNGSRATFRDGEIGDEDMQEEQEVASGVGWRMMKPDEGQQDAVVVGLAEAVERYGKKRALNSDDLMEGIEVQSKSSTVPPPRKKARGTVLPPLSTMNAAAPPSPLPSPHGSPPPEAAWLSAPPSGTSSPTPQAPFQPDLSLTTLLTLPSLLSHFNNLPPPLQSHFLLTLLRHSPLPVLRSLHSVLTPILARDFLTLLPPELVSHILSFLPFSTVARASRVSRSWRNIIDSDPVLWRDLLKSTKIWFGGESEAAFANSIYARRRHNPVPRPLSLPHPYKMLFKSRHLTHTRWVNNPAPKHVSFPAHGSSVVTCLIFSHGRIISASDDHSIHVYSPITGELLRSLQGHDGGVWALAACKDTLVSGSTDRTVRIWDLSTGECQHVLAGHTSLVGLLGLSPSYLVSAAADSTLRIWDPDTGEIRHTLAAHTGAITCFQHDEFKVLSGSDGNLKMWNIRDGSVVRDLLTGITGVWQVVFEGRWVVAASNRNDATVLDVWDFGLENDDDWIGEPPGGLYDEDIFSDEEDEDEGEGEEGYATLKAKRGNEEDEEQEQKDVDAMDEDLVASSDTDSVVEIEYEGRRSEVGNTDVEIPDASEGVEASRWAPQATVSVSTLTAGEDSIVRRLSRLVLPLVQR
ncbi:hypothetical protein M413DRAFT_6022 [Hebeloma cylindrosporum]|uniref:F-box domain-containing protein n=1 Tax=Hebeloma cylindrosporum TaxID=76867 RepID=A0A0C3CXV6_HEBCY|nr:hypothetical protein M413DRAFT_6022 [Hebeloma cylindrosporum h7]